METAFAGHASDPSSAESRAILVIDDDILFRRLHSRILSRLGLPINTACDPVEAMQRIRVDFPALIVCDNQMPHQTGIDFCRALRQNDAFRAIPFMLVTSDSELGVELTRPDELPDRILPKGLNAAEFVSCAATLLNGTRCPEQQA